MKRKWFAVAVGIVVLLAGLSYLSEFFLPEENKELRQEVRKAVAKTFPQQAAEVASSFGLTPYQGGSESAVATDPAAPVVVLVHGLDDPGKVWRNLAPALASENFNVWILNYPNDQPIVDSARLFQAELARLKQTGIGQISIVAHSMGGLVSREMLTNPQMAYGDKAGRGELPGVTALVMVGTPNHGSEFARFRVFSEFRDQWVNMTENGGHILRGFLDGAGEAKIDLLPQSRFLQTLNSRPHPEGLRMLVIAGVVSPWDEKEVSEFLYSTLDNENAADTQAFIKSVSDGLGDGVVTVESSRLQGVEHQTVPGTHLTMIRNMTSGSSNVPPAVPLIIEFLVSGG